MKKVYLFIFSLISISLSAQWWDSERIDGNGVITKISRNVGDFTSVSSSGSFNVELTFGKPGSISLEGEENLLPLIQSKVENNQLILKFKNKINIRNNKKITIYVAMSRVEGLYLSGSGNINGSGDFGNQGNTSFKVSGSGNINLDFDRIAATSLAISGSGKIILKGKTDNLGIQISGSGGVDCAALIAKDVEVQISGSGTVNVHADETLEANISGSGNINYSGNAKNVTKHTAGSGKIRKV
ncbi:MAG: DUF2807 domain-containing protein [Sphingobacteriia bacterium]|nr:MAG: DUF2807 domain-containing protein [Sphingobacteriia bacterium]TAG29223.1 MAG: DUF2807 domain-containing protein [Sphingobacteriia bacterium]